ncbi:MAG: hypothetical protein F6K31_28790 [Symploca sp. SIO2G7]|nr:hypothetical protein [Symploca sp. SIO2G7]
MLGVRCQVLGNFRRKYKYFEPLDPTNLFNSQFSIFNSQFSIFNSQFSILNSQFSILNLL